MPDVNLTNVGGDVLLDDLVKPPEQPGAFAKGIRSSYEGIKSTAGGLVRLAGKGFGAKPVEQYGADLAAQADEAAAADSMRVEDVHGVGDAVNFLKYGAGYVIPQLLLAVAGGAVGRGIGNAASRSVAEKATRNLIEQAGMAGGAYAISAGQEIGSIYNDAVKEGTKDAETRSITGGLAAGLLDVVPEALAARKLGLLGNTAGAGKKGFGAIAGQAGKVAAQGAGLEAVTEGAQTGIERLAAGQSLTGPEANSDYLNSAVLGAIGGGVVGAPIGAVEATRAAKEAPPALPPAPAAQEPLPTVQPDALPQLNPSLVPNDPIAQAEHQAALQRVQEPINTELEHSFVSGQRDQLQAKLDTLQKENDLPKDQRRSKQDIATQIKLTQALIAAHNEHLTSLNALITPSPLNDAIDKQKFAKRFTKLDQMEQAAPPINDAPAEVSSDYKPKGTVSAEGVVVPREGLTNQRYTSEVLDLPGNGAVDTRGAALQIARIKRDNGQLLTAEEAKLLRGEQKAAPTLALGEASNPREVSKSLPAKERQEAFRDTIAKAATSRVDEMIKAGALRDKIRTSTVNAINLVASKAAQAPTEAAAHAEIANGIAKVLKGKVNQNDVSVFTESLLRDVQTAPVTFFSKAKTVANGMVTFTHWGNVPNGVLDPSKIGTGVKGRDQAAAVEFGIPYSSAVVRGSSYTEPAVQSRQEHVGAIPGAQVYQAQNWRADPLYHQALASIFKRYGNSEDIAFAQYMKSIRDQGFKAAEFANGQLRIFANDVEAHPVPSVSAMQERATAILSRHNSTGGSSTNMVTGVDLGGTHAYAVSVYKGREVQIPGQPTQAQLRDYIAANQDLLGDPNNVLGTWFNPKDEHTYLDISVTAPNVQIALALGRENNQLAVFYLRTFDTIPVGSKQLFDIAQVYNSLAGLPPAQTLDYAKVQPNAMREIANAYEKLDVDNRLDLATQRAYAQFIAETEAQFEFLSQYIKIEPYTPPSGSVTSAAQPYANSADMMKDVLENKHLSVWTGGDDHPLMTREQNWHFRAVHDIFGHAKTGFEFGARGELNATRAHAQMYGSLAIPALVTETIGQNAWVNFSATNEGKTPADKAYAVQKADLLPTGLWQPLLADVRRAQNATVDHYDAIYQDKGRDAIELIRGIVGNDPKLELRLFQAQPGDPAGSYTRASKHKDIIELATNQKDILSTAAHEAYHYLEERTLPGSERAVLQRAFANGKPLFTAVLDQARAYDRLNGTQLADEILSIPQEARAYGFQFWRQGKLQADGAIARAFQKIQQVLERISNWVRGHGFTSAEDIFDAIEKGKFAQRDGADIAVIGQDNSDWAGDVEPDLVPTLHRKDQPASTAKGRPFWVTSGAMVGVMRQRLKKLALEGEGGRNWHANSGEAILKWADGDQKKAGQLAALISNFSPRTPVGQDLKKAIIALAQFDQKQELNPGSTQEHIAGATRILTGLNKDGTPVQRDAGGNIEPTGIKRQNFFKNLMLGVDPVNYNAVSQGSTIDMWMAHAFGFGNGVEGSVNKSQYNYADAEVKRLGAELGWQTEQTQAAIWVAIKARATATRNLIKREATRKGWYEEGKQGARVIKMDKQRQFVSDWMQMSLAIPLTQAMVDKSNYDYAHAFEDLYTGRIDLTARLETLPFELRKDPEQDSLEMAPQPTLFSKAAIIEMGRRARDGELEHEQMMSSTADLLDNGQLPDSTFKEIFGTSKDSFVGGLKRWRLENVASGNYISKFSKGYANVQKVLLAFTQRKNTLIADGVDVRLSEWRNGASNADIEAVGRVLMERTEKGYIESSPEYQNLVTTLTEKQKKMFDQANSMIADRLNKEFQADATTMRKVLNDAQFDEWQAQRSTQVQKLISQGYVPERRYGDYVVHVYLPTQDKTGKASRLTMHYEQFESETEAKLTLKKYQEILAREAPELVAEAGYRYKAERDTSLSFQQFLDTTRRYGIELSQAEKERLAKAMISADSIRRNRIFRRKNIPGYSQDVMRVISEFAVTMSNKIAYSEYSPAIEDSLKGLSVEIQRNGSVSTPVTTQNTDLWRGDGSDWGFYRNQADELVDHVLTPAQTGEWSRKFRMLASLHFLGGSLAAGLVQLSSLPMNTVPWLFQHTSYTDAFAKTTAALSVVTKNLNDLRDLSKLQNRDIAIPAIDSIPGLRDALIQAGEDGTTLDTEIYQIMGLTRGGMLAKSRKVQKAVETWMLPFRVTEQMNRMSTFIAAYRIGQDEKQLAGRDLYQFAQEAVHNTQFRYDEANRPALARDPIWAILFTFKSYPIYMLEMIETLYRQSPSAAVVMLTSLAMAAGINGLPFAEDMQDLVDTIAQRLFGSPFNSKRAIRNIAKTASESIVGADLSSVVLNGVVNEVTGMSFASRVGLGNMIPGTRLGAADNDYGRTMNEILGPVASIVTGALHGAESLTKGQFLDAFKQAGPQAVQNAIKGAEEAAKGYATDNQGRKLVDVSELGAFMQTLGFSPASLSKAYEMDRMDKQTVAFYKMVRDDFTKEFVQAMVDNKPEKAQEIITSLGKWNQAHPDMPMTFDAGVMRRRIVEAGLPLNQRTLLMLPKQLRGSSVALEGR